MFRHFAKVIFGAALLSWCSASAELPEPPGPAFEIPAGKTGEGAPSIASWTDDAGPDETFLLFGDGLTDRLIVWGVDPASPAGREVKPKIQFATRQMMAATLPERAYDGIFLIWVENDVGRSQPIVLNAPQPWWCHPRRVEAGATVRVFGRNLARRPHFGQAFLYLESETGGGRWLPVVKAEKYQVVATIPEDVPPGQHRLWVHAGCGGDWGWGGPLALQLFKGNTQRAITTQFSGGNLQVAVNQVAQHGGGILELPAGVFELPGTLVIPAGVVVQGQGRDKTILQAPSNPTIPFARFDALTWNQSPTGIHTPGDTMVYRVTFPRAGQWFVWLRYATTEMAPWGLPGVSGRMTLTLDDQSPVPLENLPNTGSFGTFRWSRAAELTASAGEHRLVWKNVQGGGIHIDAFVFSDDPEWQPAEDQFPESGPRLVVLQGEDVIDFQTKEGSLPVTEKTCVWLAGDGAGVSSLTILGSIQTNLGIVVRHPQYPRWVRDCRIEDVLVKDCQGKQAENCGVRLFHAESVTVRNCELWGRSPLFLSGVRQGNFSHNRLVSVTLWGGNAEGYINGRNEPIEECIIEENVCATPPGAKGGGPTGRRMIWLSTGRGSVSHNWIANNREDRAIFGGVAGTDQNVGEMILFEACQRIAYFGPIVAADKDRITLPATVPTTPDEWLGNVDRRNLAYDGAGHETPFWPPREENEREAVLTEYYVTVLDGPALGQTRRVIDLNGTTYRLDRSWQVIPPPGSRVVISTAFYQNHIVGNRTVDGMTGIQLWISCIENIVSDNEVARQRKPAVFLYGTCTTLASSMPMTWNHGIGPLYFNHVEGTRTEETSCGIFLVSGESGQLPVLFPRCLGNVLRHNGLIKNRTSGVLITGNRNEPKKDGYTAVMGTIAEFNLVRDALRGFQVARSVEGTVLRRNHIYFWYPVSVQSDLPVAFQIDDPDS
ncbi:MAG: hypothetical protein ACUVQR_00990, partial [Thermogutta sp.]